MNLTIDPQKVKDAAAKCATAAEILKTLFPEVFKDESPKPFEFGNSFQITCYSNNGSHPLIIADGLAPNGFEGKCLAVSVQWEMKTDIIRDRTILTFYPKK